MAAGSCADAGKAASSCVDNRQALASVGANYEMWSLFKKVGCSVLHVDYAAVRQ